jgi:hypothetical protein
LGTYKYCLVPKAKGKIIVQGGKGMELIIIKGRHQNMYTRPDKIAQIVISHLNVFQWYVHLMSF